MHSILKVDSGFRHQMADKWSSIIENGKPGYSAIIDVNVWFGKATLDAYVLVLALVWVSYGLTANLPPERIGAGAFEYDFGALDDADNPLAKSYTDIMYDQPPIPFVYRSRLHRANRLPRLLVSHPSGTLLDRTCSSWPSRGGFLD